MFERFCVHAVSDWVFDGIKLYIRQRGRNDGPSTAYVTHLELKEFALASEIPNDEAPIRLDQESAQMLMNDLWNAGIRPSDACDKSDVINAKNQHIEDLRKALAAFIEVTKK